jgi:hypothetical protein
MGIEILIGGGCEESVCQETASRHDVISEQTQPGPGCVAGGRRECERMPVVQGARGARTELEFASGLRLYFGLIIGARCCTLCGLCERSVGAHTRQCPDPGPAQVTERQGT